MMSSKARLMLVASSSTTYRKSEKRWPLWLLWPTWTKKRGTRFVLVFDSMAGYSRDANIFVDNEAAVLKDWFSFAEPAKG
ncbi:hypothetical protein GQ600_15862 [Phytophthora cactorum]|nr:hypothetical protein GQ600_15862 [Phytophthora cactorum]